MKMIQLTVHAHDRSYPLEFPVRRMVNAGYVGRDRQAVQAHIDELSRSGIPPPTAVPALFPLATDNLTTANQVEVIGGRSSGEVEYVLFLTPDDILVGVGSDHTDRALERQSLVKSKQICPNVVSTEVWRYREVKPHWDSMLLQSWIKSSDGDKEVLYQRATLASILPADDLLALVRSRLKDGQTEGLVLFSGTVPVLAGAIVYAEFFRCELIDPRTERRLGCSYRAVPLAYLDDVDD